MKNKILVSDCCAIKKQDNNKCPNCNDDCNWININ